MIIWIDGPFGAGKTTLASRLCEKRSDLLVLDPEEIGYVVKTVVAMPPSGNYQDLPFWRRLTVQAIAELRDHYPQDIAVPMTLLNPAHRDEIFSAVRSIDSNFIHFYLDVDREILCERIVGQSMHPDESRNEQIRTWRLAQVESEPPRVYRRAKLSENCPLWNRHQRRELRSRFHPSSANARCG